VQLSVYAGFAFATDLCARALIAGHAWLLAQLER
jgi:hypothetical protein